MSNFHLFRRKKLLRNDFELIVSNIFSDMAMICVIAGIHLAVNRSAGVAPEVDHMKCTVCLSLQCKLRQSTQDLKSKIGVSEAQK